MESRRSENPEGFYVVWWLLKGAILALRRLNGIFVTARLTTKLRVQVARKTPPKPMLARVLMRSMSAADGEG